MWSIHNGAYQISNESMVGSIHSGQSTDTEFDPCARLVQAEGQILTADHNSSRFRRHMTWLCLGCHPLYKLKML